MLSYYSANHAYSQHEKLLKIPSTCDMLRGDCHGVELTPRQLCDQQNLFYIRSLCDSKSEKEQQHKPQKDCAQKLTDTSWKSMPNPFALPERSCKMLQNQFGRSSSAVPASQ